MYPHASGAPPPRAHPWRVGVETGHACESKWPNFGLQGQKCENMQISWPLKRPHDLAYGQAGSEGASAWSCSANAFATSTPTSKIVAET